MARTKVNLKWRNKYSGEEGYVKRTSVNCGYFENTFNKSEAKKYVNTPSVDKELEFLKEIGETANNEFFTEEY